MDKIDKYINDELNRIDEEVNRDQDIRDRAKYIYSQLKLHPKYRDNFEGKDYDLYLQMTGNKIILFASNVATEKIIGSKYRPYSFSAEYDQTVDMDSICETLISTFIAHISGRLTIETEDGIEFV